MHLIANKNDTFCLALKKWHLIKFEDLNFLNKLTFSFKRHYVTKDFQDRIKEINNHFFEINNKHYYINLSKCLLNYFFKKNFNINTKHFYFTLFHLSDFLSVIPSCIVFKISLNDFNQNILNNTLFQNANSDYNLITLFSIEKFQNVLLKNDNLFYMNSNLILDYFENKIYFQYLTLDLDYEKIEIVPKKFFYNDYYKNKKINYQISFLKIRYFLINYRNFSNKGFLLLHNDFYIFFFKKKNDMIGIFVLKENDSKNTLI